MSRRALWSAAPVLSSLVFMNACTPGPVTARSAGGGMSGAGNTGGSAVRGSGRDAAPPATDAATATRTRDAGLPADGPLPETPRSLARDGATAAGMTDALRDVPVDAFSARPPRPGEVAIDELLVNPTGDDLGREWIELVSSAPEPLDLSQLHLATASTDVVAAAGTIGPGSLLLLGQSTDPTKNGGAPVAVAYNTKLILLNANGQLSICLGPCATGVVIDTVSWGALSDDQTGHALIVDPATRDLCTAVTPFGTAGSCGTPGAPNPPCAENVDGGSRRDVSVAD